MLKHGDCFSSYGLIAELNCFISGYSLGSLTTLLSYFPVFVNSLFVTSLSITNVTRICLSGGNLLSFCCMLEDLCSILKQREIIFAFCRPLFCFLINFFRIQMVAMMNGNIKEENDNIKENGHSKGNEDK